MIYAGELVAKDNRSTERPYRVALGSGFAVDAARIGNEVRRGVEENDSLVAVDDDTPVVAVSTVKHASQLD